PGPVGIVVVPAVMVEGRVATVTDRDPAGHRLGRVITEPDYRDAGPGRDVMSRPGFTIGKVGAQ
ncbi:MAG: hypothetical protein PHI71_05180, partial [Acidiphilium sp.]|nr:hypothetical protein [Acidiphilium sp.]